MSLKKKLPDSLNAIMETGDFDAFCKTMKKCEPNALTFSGNAFTLPHLTEQHVRWLIDYGTDVNFLNRWGVTPLAEASRMPNDDQTIELLIRYGADIHLGYPVHAAAEYGRTEKLRILLNHGASPSSLNTEGLTPLEYALAHISGASVTNIEGAIELLVRSGAVISNKARADFARIAESIEFYRDGFSEEVEQEVDAAMDQLHLLFGTTPPPRRLIHDGISPIRVPDGSWQQQYDALWNLLVPASGPCKTVQGEIIRLVGKLSHELLDNGGGNWNRNFELMLAWLGQQLIQTDALNASEQEEAARRIHALLRRSISEEDHEALCRLAVKCVLLTPTPLPLGQTAYRS